MCAAPGGKTTAIGILMRDKGEVVALDRSHNKVNYSFQIKPIYLDQGFESLIASRTHISFHNKMLAISGACSFFFFCATLIWCAVGARGLTHLHST
jgi:hypothetical protein